MTTRQMLSIVLSTILFGHSMGTESMLGAVVVFLAVFHSIHRQVKESKEKKAQKEETKTPEGEVAGSKEGGLELSPK